MEVSDEWNVTRDTRQHLTMWLARHLIAERNQRRLAVFTLPAPHAPLETFLNATERNYGVVWHPPGATAWAGAGAAKVIPLRGRDGLELLRTEVRSTFDLGVHYVCPGCDASPLRIFGGIAFAPDGNDLPPWTEFSDGCFSLPRWTYERGAGGATLSFAAQFGDDDPLKREETILAEYETISEALHNHDRVSTHGAHFQELLPIESARIYQLPHETWRAYIEAIRHGIRDGAFFKVVAARLCVVDLPQTVLDTTVLARLGADFPDTTRFAFRRQDTTLLGVTPEVLFSKSGRTLETEALAGTRRSLGSDFPRSSKQAETLLASAKDQLEQGLVLRQIVEKLTPLVERIAWDPQPRVRKIRNILHLDTPVHAEIQPGVDAIDLLSALHPTAAVGGTPRDNAVAFIRAHEHHPRGWYAGAVGWIDAAGDACFNVVIRSGVLNRGRRAYIYTGAGIVADSDADAEYAETALKQQPMLRALGMHWGTGGGGP